MKNLKLMATATKIQNIAAGINPEHREGKVARAIEEQTAKLPSDSFYGLQSVQWHAH